MIEKRSEKYIIIFFATTVNHKSKYITIAENDQERVEESLDKEYDEQEADDEIDEESDAPAEPHVMQRNAVKKDALLRTQQRIQINQQQNPHGIRYAQYSPKLYQAHPLPTRFVK